MGEIIRAQLPKITIAIPTYNEKENIERCLSSIFNQNYPKDLLEVLVIDDISTDNTIELANKYNVKIIVSGNKDAEISKMIGLHNASGELFMYLDADIELVGTDWFRQIVKPLIEDESIVGSFPRFVPKKSDVAIGRFLRYHELELDPVFQFFCTEISDTILEDKKEYLICSFNPPKIPPIGICVYRRKILENVIVAMKKFMDIDVPVILSKKGFNKFSYVPSCGIYHTNIKSLKEIIQRRQRNIDKVYLPNVETREFTYFNLKNKCDIFKIVFWIIYANLFLPSLIKGFYKMSKNKDIACMYEPIVALLLTDCIAFGFLKNGTGRKMIKRMLKL
jgi:glycosyltransferase involved in cell wall biosynthesis